MKENWHNKVGNPAQLGGIETSVLDNGLGHGTRIAWINTGTGLRYKVVLDRAMDIADAFYNQYSLAWLSHSGVTPPVFYPDRGIEWLRTFGGGLLTTCGMSHVGGPDNGERGLHGRISNTPAEIISIIQPDPQRGRLDMSITGRILETTVFGPTLELRRTISGKLGEAFINIQDEVTNLGNAEVPHMLLYHLNFGYPLVDEGAKITWKGEWDAREGDDTKIFLKGNDYRTCPAPLDDHASTGEEAAFIQPEADENGISRCGIHNARLGIDLEVSFNNKQLPWLTNWQHWGKHEYVTGLEPGTNPPIGQNKAREQSALIILKPGESRKYDLKMEVIEN